MQAVEEMPSLAEPPLEQTVPEDTNSVALGALATKANDTASNAIDTSQSAVEAEAVNRKSGRPIGISKIDLRTVWGSKTPLIAPDGNSQSGKRLFNLLYMHSSPHSWAIEEIICTDCKSTRALCLIPDHI